VRPPAYILDVAVDSFPQPQLSIDVIVSIVCWEKRMRQACVTSNTVFLIFNRARASRVGIYTSFGPSIPVYTCIYTDTRIYGLNTYDD